MVVVLPRADVHAATGQRQCSAHVGPEAAAPAEYERRLAGQRLCRRLEPGGEIREVGLRGTEGHIGPQQGRRDQDAVGRGHHELRIEQAELPVEPDRPGLEAQRRAG